MPVFLTRIKKKIEDLINKTGFGIQTKLIIIFVVIKVIPLILLTLMAWKQAANLGKALEERSRELAAAAGRALSNTGEIAVNDSVAALNAGAITEIERMSTDLAMRVANFLYDRDRDIRYVQGLVPSEGAYRLFLQHKLGTLVKQREWVLSPDQSHWIPRDPLKQGIVTSSSNRENDTGYRSRGADLFETEERPLFLEATFVDLSGNELIKVSTTPGWDRTLRNVSNKRHTYAGSESYWNELAKLQPGDIYVSDVIGEYVRSRLIGMYNPANAAERGLPWQPREEAYAGRENPNGRRFKGIIRWAAPVVRNGVRIGYVTLALDHDHIMEFTDRITPMEERYVEMPSAYEGNYAFIWDYRCRSICHPRHHSIVGYNKETGEPEVPWLEESIYRAWQESGKPYGDFIKDVPVFQDQSRNKRPAPELTAAGLVGLDGRYLNNAPQCTGWFDLTREGGSGSFLILWSGIWKPNTAAAIRYYTGNYGKTKRGFGFVAIGAGLEDFQRPALETKKVLDQVIARANTELTQASHETQQLISRHLFITTASLAGSAGIMIILVVFIAFWMANILTRSIDRLIAGISRFRSGERQFRFKAQEKDEIGVLANSFDEMADSLNASVGGFLVIIGMDQKLIYVNELGLKAMNRSLEEIQGRPYAEISIYPNGSPSDPIAALLEGRKAETLYLPETKRYVRGSATWLVNKGGEKTGYVITTTDVTDMALVQKQLEKAVAEANQANQHKGDFLARMSHEIRTPMNAIMGMTKIIEKKLEDRKDLKADVRQIEVASQHLLGLINDILDLSKIEAGKIELNYEDTDLLKLVRTVEVMVRPRCEEKEISLETHFEFSTPAYFRLDPLRLRQVLINLLGNSIKFTPQGGAIVYSVVEKEKRDESATICFSIKDTGIGISKTAQLSLFKPFEQTSADISKRYGGTGLGLAISRNIVNLYGGEITVESDEGAGSAFSFTLVLNTCPVTEETPVPQDLSQKLTGKRALLVDDVPINRMILASLLENTGLAIDEAQDGQEALTLFRESPENTYDIIYMDVQMPNMDGYEASLAIRALDRGDAQSVSIVALTANAFKEDRARALASGMNAHLAKPIEVDKCLEVTFRLLKP
ncbi:MAG: response regulator [Spirochaetaceae bacterium]|jgi:signal transduction histidine kinase/CheY-like chemotaxis protein/HAMP domain-containing protein|nr:response regulator [Spirochaetaceae bacterium]